MTLICATVIAVASFWALGLWSPDRSQETMGQTVGLSMYPERIAVPYRPLMTPLDVRQVTFVPDLLAVAKIEHAEAEREFLAKTRAAERQERELAVAASKEEERKRSEAKLESEQEAAKQAQLKEAAAQREKAQEAQEQNRQTKMRMIEQNRQPLLNQMEVLKSKISSLRTRRVSAVAEYQGYAEIAQHYVNFPNYEGQLAPEASVRGPGVNEVMPSIRLSEASPDYRALVGNLSRTWHLVAGIDAELNAADIEMRQLYNQVEKLRQELLQLQ
jgi:hypothetical protein